MEHATDLDALWAQYPDWQISERWLSASTGPDARVLHVQRGDALISAWTVAPSLLARYVRARNPQVGVARFISRHDRIEVTYHQAPRRKSPGAGAHRGFCL